MRASFLGFSAFIGLGALVLSSATGCGMSTYQASSGVKFDVDSAHQIDDEDVAKAFAAQPQLGRRALGTLLHGRSKQHGQRQQGGSQQAQQS